MSGTTWKYEWELECQRQREIERRRRIRVERVGAAMVATAGLVGGILVAWMWGTLG